MTNEKQSKSLENAAELAALRATIVAENLRLRSMVINVGVEHSEAVREAQGLVRKMRNS